MNRSHSSNTAKWRSVRIGDVVLEMAAGTSVNGSDQSSMGAQPAVLKISAVTEGVFKPEENKVIVEADISFASRPPKAGRVLVSRANTPELVGASAYVSQDYDYLFLPDKLWMIEHDPKLIASAKWLHELLTSSSYRQKLRDIATGSSNSMKNISQEAFLGLRIALPPPQIQIAIAEVADCWNISIQKSTALLTALEQRKQGLMQQLLTGRRRLKGFKGKWREVALDHVLERVTRKNSNGCSNALTVSAQRGLVAQGSYFAKQIAAEVNEHYVLLKKGEFAYNRSAANGYPFGAIKRLEAHDEGIVSTLCLCFGVRDAGVLDSDFLVWLIEAGQLDRAICRIAHEGARSHGLLNVTASDFFGIKASIPGFAEQRAIATILNDVKVEIEALQSQIEALKTQKRALMQKLLSGEWRMPKAAFSRKDSA